MALYETFLSLLALNPPSTSSICFHPNLLPLKNHQHKDKGFKSSINFIMPRKLQKSLQGYLSKIKSPSTSRTSSVPNILFPSNPSFSSSSKSWILSGCKHPKTPSFAIDPIQNEGGGNNKSPTPITTNTTNNNNKDNNDAAAATLSDIDRFLVENFKSLYVKNDEEDHHHHNSQNEKKYEEEGRDDCQYHVKSPVQGGVLFESPRFFDPPPDLCRSSRFFVTPGSSGSIVEEARTSLATTTTSEDVASSSTSTNTLNDSVASCSFNTNGPKKVTLPDDSIAVLTYSQTPQNDFRRSMQDMVDARLQCCGKVDWDFLEEILFCYLNLNEKKSHKFILSAFVDLIVSLRQSSGKVPSRSRNTSRIARERRRRLRNVT